MLVVKPNQDPTSSFKWLVRDEREAPEMAVPRKFVACHDVILRASNKFEEGFGAKLVIFCRHAVGYDVPMKLKSTGKTILRVGEGWLQTLEGQVVTRCNSLELTHKGLIVAVL